MKIAKCSGVKCANNDEILNFLGPMTLHTYEITQYIDWSVKNGTQGPTKTKRTMKSKSNLSDKTSTET